LNSGASLNALVTRYGRRCKPGMSHRYHRLSLGCHLYLNLGVVDELEIALVPVFFGGGRRLFENLSEPGPQFRIVKLLDGAAATHLRYVRQ